MSSTATQEIALTLPWRCKYKQTAFASTTLTI